MRLARVRSTPPAPGSHHRQADRRHRQPHPPEAAQEQGRNRDVVVDDTAAVLTAYHARKAAQKLAAGPDWRGTDLSFVQPNGRPWHPNSVTQRFRRPVRRAGLPPIRLHDLRHGADTMALETGIDIKVVQEQPGHSTSTLTRDTYQSVAKALQRKAAVAKNIRKRRHSA